MNGKDLDRAIVLTKSDPDSFTIRACRLVVDHGVSVYAAARHLEVSHPAIYRKMAQLRAALALPVCQTCGQTTDGENTWPRQP